MKNVTILGSTGTIGENTLNVIAGFPSKFNVFALTANKSIEKLYRQVLDWRPRYAVLSCTNSAKILSDKLKSHSAIKTEVIGGPESLQFVAAHEETDYVMAAIVGGAGLLSSMSAARHGKRILLANKESLVMSGELFMNEVKNSGSQLLPIDSEHNAIFQCLPFDYGSPKSSSSASITKLILTGSGGPFLNTSAEKLSDISVEQACNHPNWVMGQKISIDSATMMNKVFEVIEAKKIFNVSLNKIKVFSHPESYVHAIVKFKNGLTKILIHDTNMKIPIFNSLFNQNEKIKSDKLNIKKLNNLNLKIINKNQFPSLNLIKYFSSKNNSLLETVLVSANDELVDLFLKNKIKYLDITKNLLNVLKLKEFKRLRLKKPINLAQIIRLNKYVRLKTRSLCVRSSDNV